MKEKKLLEKRPRGKPPYVATDIARRQVAIMAAAGLTRQTVIKIMKIGNATFAKHHEADYQTGLETVTASLAERVYAKALSDDNDSLQASIFLLKTRAKWKEEKHVELTGPNNQPLIPPQVINPRQLPAETKEAIYNALQLISAQKEATDADYVIEDGGSEDQNGSD